MNEGSLRVAVLGPVWFPVPPSGYGGIEWIVSLLADGLVDAGHDVTLFASGDSLTKAKLAYVYAEAPSQLDRTFALGAQPRARLLHERADEFDVINDHTGMPAARSAGSSTTPVVHTVHGPLDGEPGAIYEQVARVAPQRRPDLAVDEPAASRSPTCPGSRTARTRSTSRVYPCKPHRGDYLLFLGRHEPRQGLPPRDRGRDGDAGCR